MQVTADQIEQATRGERAAREALSAWCLKRAFRMAYVDLGIVPNRAQTAEEIAGEASLKADSHLAQFQAGTRFESWLHQIVRNCIRDYYRRTDRAFPHAIYQRWVHDFLAACGPDLEALIQRELGQRASAPHPAFLAQIATDLGRLTYRQFMRLTYEGRAHVVLEAVERQLRSFVGVHWLPLYDRDEAGEWIETDLPGGDETETQVLQHEFVQQVNERLAGLQPFCRRLIRWYYLDQLRVADIARLENLNERTTYRRLDNCSASFRARLLRGSFFAEYAAQQEATADAPS